MNTLPNEVEIATNSLTVVDRALSLPTIQTPEDYILAGNLTLAINDFRKEIVAHFKKKKADVDVVKKSILDEERVALAPLDNALSHVEPLIASYLREERRKKAEAEAKAQEEARKRAEEELLARAKKAEDAGNQEAARAILEEPVVLKAVGRVAPIPSVRGIATVEVWKFRVTDFPALVKAVASGDAPMECLTADTVFLTKEAKACKGASPYPGVQFYSEDSVRKG
jgi:hypothetical protein